MKETCKADPRFPVYKEHFNNLGMETQDVIKEENTELTTYIKTF